MTNDPLLSLWKQAGADLTGHAGQRLADDFIRRLRARRRLQALWLAWSVLALGAATVLATRTSPGVFEGSAPRGVALVLMLLVPWAATVHFLRGYWRAGRPPTAIALPLREALALAFASLVAERGRLRLIAGLLVAMMPVTGYAILELATEGKVAGHEVWSLAAVCTVGLVGGLAAVAFRYFHTVLPEGERLAELRRDLEGGSAG